MIKIQKSPTIPKPLDGTDSLGTQATKKLCDDHVAGVKKLEFKSDIYGHPEVKKQLLQDQHSKCGYCEGKFLGNDYGDVEHFRPKAAYKQKADETLRKPGYYWLAYDWSNLTLSCSRCNRGHKKNHFPLFNPRDRAKSHRDDIAKERPILVNPVAEDPQQFIGFHDSVAYGIDSQQRGATTIETVGLNRALIEEDRREHLLMLRKLWEATIVVERDGQNPTWVRETRDFIWAEVKPDKQYSAMVAAFLSSVTHPAD